MNTFHFVRQWVRDHPARAGTLSGWFQQGCGLAATFFTIPALLNPAMLAPHESGLWFAFQGLLAMVNLTDFGLGMVIARQAAYTFRRTGDHNPAAANDFIPLEAGWAGLAQLYQVAKRLFARVTIAGVVLVILGYHALLPFGKLAEYMSPSNRLAWYLVGGSMLVSLQSKLFQGLLDGVGRNYVGRLASGASMLLFGGISLGVLYLKPSLPLLGAAALIGSLAQYSFLRWYLLRLAAGRLNDARWLAPEVQRRFWKVAVPLGVVLSSAFLATAVQVPLLGFVMGATAVAPYYLAQRIAQVGTIALLQLNGPQIPLFTQQISACDWVGAGNRFKKSALIVVGLATFVFGIFFFASPTAVELWVGAERFVDQWVLGVVALEAFMTTGIALASHYVVAAGRNPFVWTTVAAGILNVCGCLILPRHFGLLGLAMAGVLAGLLTNYWWVPLQMYRVNRWLQSHRGCEQRGRSTN